MLQELTPGSVVAERFEVERLAGSGGMGAVYRAYDRWTGQPVALKVLFDGADKVRFTREALLLAELSHPGIVGYVSHGHLDGGSPFFIIQQRKLTDVLARPQNSQNKLLTLLITDKHLNLARQEEIHSLPRVSLSDNDCIFRIRLFRCTSLNPNQVFRVQVCKKWDVR